MLNPSQAELKESELDLVVAGTKDAVLMVESETSGLTEKIMLDAVKFGHENFVSIIEAIESLAKKLENQSGKLRAKIFQRLKRKLQAHLKLT